MHHSRRLGVAVTAALAAVALTASAAWAAPAPAPATTGPGVVTDSRAATEPKVTPDGFAAFSVTLPSTAKAVTITGSWGPSYVNVTSPMSGGNGRFTALIGPLVPGLYSYNLTVDGVATKDPGNRTVVHSNPAMSTFFVPGAGAELLTPSPGAKGTTTTLRYHSDVTGTTRPALVWTPPGYAASRQPYPTFYLFHGGGGDYLDWVQQGRADVILDNLYAQHRIKPMVVVMGDANVPGATGLPEDDQFVPEVLDNLVPAVQRKFNVSTSSHDMALAGLSLGGLQTFNTVLARPGAFSEIGDMSSGYFPEVIDQLRTQDRALLTNPAINQSTRMFRIYIGSRADIAYDNNIATRNLFDRFGIRYQFGGSYPLAGHVWKTFDANLIDFAPRLF